MEEDKAAAYYDELSRKGEGAARFKQGLGFSSSSSASDLKRPPSAATSFLSNFVRASSPGKATEIQKEAQLERIQNKLKKKPPLLPPSKPSPSGGDGDADRRRRRRSRSRSRSRERYRDRCRSPGRETDRSPRRHHSQGRRREDEEEKYRSRRLRTSRSRSASEERERSRQSRHGDKRERGDYSSRRGRGSKSPPSSPESRAADRGRRDVNGEDGKKRDNNWSRGPASSRDRNASTDYSQLIEGYSQMTPAERVKAKMKFQLSKTVAMDMAKGVTTGWERFQFDKEAPLDDEDIEVAEDDETLVKDIERSFRYSAVEAKREEDIKAAHDEAMFGVSVASPMIPVKEDSDETDEKGASVPETLVNEKARAIQGSWRDRLRNPQHGLGNADG